MASANDPNQTIVLEDSSDSSDGSDSDIECLGDFPAASRPVKVANAVPKRAAPSSRISDPVPSCSRNSPDSSEASTSTGVKRTREESESDTASGSSSSSSGASSPSTSSDIPFLSLDPTVSPPSESKFQEIDLIIQEFGLKDGKTGIEEDFTLFRPGNGLRQALWKCRLSFSVLPLRPPSAPWFSVQVLGDPGGLERELTGLNYFPAIGVMLTFRSAGPKPQLNRVDLTSIWMDDLLVKRLEKEVVRRQQLTSPLKLIQWLEEQALSFLSLSALELLHYAPVSSAHPAHHGPGFLRLPNLVTVIEAFQTANRNCVLKESFKCLVCGDEKNVEESAVFGECGHRFCKECVQVELKGKIRRGLVDELRCFKAGCQTVPSAELVARMVDKDTFSRYCDRTADAFVSDNPMMVRCPRENCRAPVELPDGVPLPVIIICRPECRHRFCSGCKAAPHPGLACLLSIGTLVAEMSEREKQEAWDRFMVKQENRNWTPNMHKQTVILEDGKGFGLKKLLAPYFDRCVSLVEIDEPHLSSQSQIGRFVEFCAVMMTLTVCLTTIVLTIRPDKNDEHRKKQEARLGEVRAGLEQHNVQLIIKYSPHLHDRQIRLDNGWLIKMGRGLHFVKPVSKQNQLDTVDPDFRQCLGTTIDCVFKPRPSYAFPLR